MSPSIPALRLALVAQGFTLKPTCPTCGQKREPKDFVEASGVCRSCVQAEMPAERWLHGWLPSLHNNCANDQPALLAKAQGVVRIVSYPASCRGCGIHHPMTPEYSTEELAAAWVAAVAEEDAR
jgi:hypothetical protein